MFKARTQESHHNIMYQRGMLLLLHLAAVERRMTGRSRSSPTKNRLEYNQIAREDRCQTHSPGMLLQNILGAMLGVGGWKKRPGRAEEEVVEG